MIHYVCKYTPVELLKAFGLQCAFYNPTPPSLDEADKETHRNICSFSRALLAAYPQEESDAVILTECCDSIRRISDVLKTLNKQVFMLTLPRKRDACARKLFANELHRLTGELEQWSRRSFSPGEFIKAFPEPPGEHGPYIAVTGSRIGDDLLEYIASQSPLPVRNLTCTGPRSVSQPPSGNTGELLEWYAGELLAQPACMRMADLTSRRGLTEDPHLKGIIYTTVAFCDFYHFEYAQLLRSSQTPAVKIETDYTPQGKGQMISRLQAFFERFTMKSPSADMHSRKDAAGYAAGIDSGSTSTNAVIIDQDGTVMASHTLPTGVEVQRSAEGVLSAALESAGLDRSQIGQVFTTGYGRSSIGFRERDITEITCHAKGAHHLHPGVRTVIDIGGQDSKVIRLNDRGEVVDFVMNDKCAAGTGRFLEMMADSLGIDLEDMSTRGDASKEEVTISSMCSVFAQSEVVSLIASGKKLEDIVRGIHRSAAVKVTSLAGRRELHREWMVTGGVAKNAGVITALEERLGNRVILPEEPQICGALGAALLALESWQRTAFQTP